MRDFFIRGLEAVINIIMLVLMIGLVAFAAALALGAVPVAVDNNMAGTPLATARGPVAGLAVLIGGGLCLLVMGGFTYLGLGIYQNTRRTADALEKLALE